MNSVFWHLYCILASFGASKVNIFYAPSSWDFCPMKLNTTSSDIFIVMLSMETEFILNMVVHKYAIVYYCPDSFNVVILLVYIGGEHIPEFSSHSARLLTVDCGWGIAPCGTDTHWGSYPDQVMSFSLQGRNLLNNILIRNAQEEAGGEEATCQRKISSKIQTSLSSAPTCACLLQPAAYHKQSPRGSSPSLCFMCCGVPAFSNCSSPCGSCSFQSFLSTTPYHPSLVSPCCQPWPHHPTVVSWAMPPIPNLFRKLSRIICGKIFWFVF